MKKFLILSAILMLILSTGCEKQPEEEPSVEPPTQIEKPIDKEEQKPEQPIQEEEPEIILTEQELAKQVLIDKHGEEVVNAFEELSKHEHFDFADKQLVIKEWISHIGEVHYECYKVMENGSEESANFGGRYYIMGVYISDEALFDIVEYHNTYVVVN